MTSGQKKLHLSAAICFVIAILLYILGGVLYLGLSFFGFVFEIIAWISWFADEQGHNKGYGE